MINLSGNIVAPALTASAAETVQLTINFANLNSKAIARYTIQPYAVETTGNITTRVPVGAPIQGFIPDLAGMAASRAAAGKLTLATAIAAVESALQEIEHEKGTL